MKENMLQGREGKEASLGQKTQPSPQDAGEEARVHCSQESLACRVLRLLAFPAAASLASTPGLSVYWAAMCEQGELGSVNSTPRPLVHSKFT